MLGVTRGTRAKGLMTWQRAMALPPEIKDAELEYVDLRNFYVNQLARIEQFEEELKATTDPERQKELGARLHGLHGSLRDVRDRIRQAGERSYAEAFYTICVALLSKETMRQLEDQTEKALGRNRHELSRRVRP